MSNYVGRLSPGVWAYPGDPTGAPISAFNPPAGAIVLDSLGGTPSIKTSGRGSNAGYERVVDGALRATAIAYAATITPNSETTDLANVAALTGNITIANPTGTPSDGQKLQFRFTQDGTGSRTLTWGNAFAFGTDITAALIPSTASAKWEMVFEWNATDSKWRAVGIARGF